MRFLRRQSSGDDDGAPLTMPRPDNEARRLKQTAG